MWINKLIIGWECHNSQISDWVFLTLSNDVMQSQKIGINLHEWSGGC
jgi:hypothetical protein